MEKQESSTAGKGDTQVSSTLEGLVEMLSDDNEGKRWKAAESLGRMGDPRAVEPLIDTLWDDDVRVRLKAAWALGMLRDPRALYPLQKLYRIEREDARESIQEAMEMIKQAMSGNQE
ncbi:HEAT repeat domain-containing protein [Methanoregula sp.]|jgi:HEAT repeat protein|uniref:HEAT repeat domain-containing protein n=1 Tax=Methanoregula sp. TaxID=2052170 RepID=UPI003C192DE4